VKDRCEKLLLVKLEFKECLIVDSC